MQNIINHGQSGHVFLVYLPLNPTTEWEALGTKYIINPNLLL